VEAAPVTPTPTPIEPSPVPTVEVKNKFSGLDFLIPKPFQAL
jgi:hypothetical protein